MKKIVELNFENGKVWEIMPEKVLRFAGKKSGAHFFRDYQRL